MAALKERPLNRRMAVAKHIVVLAKFTNFLFEPLNGEL